MMNEFHLYLYALSPDGGEVRATIRAANTVTTCYDPEGHVVAQRGATYPVDYSYDEFGEKIAMTTYRNAGGPGFVPAASAATGRPGFVPAAGDTTTWLRDEATGLVTNKVYADGKGPTYTYTPDGKLATRTWARGIVTTYSYDANGALTNTVYSDNLINIMAHELSHKAGNTRDWLVSSTKDAANYGSLFH